MLARRVAAGSILNSRDARGFPMRTMPIGEHDHTGRPFHEDVSGQGCLRTGTSNALMGIHSGTHNKEDQSLIGSHDMLATRSHLLFYQVAPDTTIPSPCPKRTSSARLREGRRRPSSSSFGWFGHPAFPVRKCARHLVRARLAPQLGMYLGHRCLASWDVAMRRGKVEQALDLSGRCRTSFGESAIIDLRRQFVAGSNPKSTFLREPVWRA